MTAISLQGLCKSFGDVRVLRDFSLEIQEGEFVSLLGPSGCGKTTTLRCVAGFEFPNDGEIHFGNRDMTWLAPEHRDVGMVFQSYALFPHMNVRENLGFGLEMRRMPEAEARKRIDTVLEMVQLTGMDSRFPRELSGGQQQRVALARALVIEPSVLLLDEPLANLDAALRDDMRYFIRDLQQRVGITSIYVTHDQSEAIVMSDRIVVMFDGQISQAGTPSDIYDRPVNRRVGEFVGTASFFEGTVQSADSGGTCRVQCGFGPVVAQASVPDGGSLTAGAKVTVMVRPENLRVGTALTESNVVGTTVRSAVYLGHSIDLTVGLPDGSVLRVDARPDCPFQPGDSVEVGFSEVNTWVLQ